MSRLVDAARAICIPYDYVPESMKPTLWTFPESHIAPRFQDIIRTGKVPGGHELLRTIQSESERIVRSTGLRGIPAFVDNYVNLVGRKAQMHTELANLIRQEPGGLIAAEKVSHILQRLAPVEVGYFAASAATKNLAELAIQQLIKVTGFSEDDILTGCHSAYQLISQIVAQQPDLSQRELSACFNGEATLRAMWCKQLPPSLKELDNSGRSDAVSPALNGVRDLIELDNVFDKMLDIKRPFMHDILATYRTAAAIDGEWSGDAIGSSVEFIIREFTRGILNITGRRDTKIVPGATLGRASAIGSKGLALEVIAAAGVPVPGFIALPMDDIEAYQSMSSTGWTELLDRAVGVAPHGLIVRSSHLGEDSFTESKAGHYLSIRTSTNPSDVVDAIKAVVESAVKQGVTPAIVIQRYIAGELSGVAFAQEEGVTIEAVRGGAEGCVGGDVTPTSHFIAAQDLAEEQPNSIVHKVARIVDGLRKIVKANVDVEFICANDEPWIVQCRPITAGLAPQVRHIAVHSGQEIITENALVVVEGATTPVPIFTYPDQVERIRDTPCCVYTKTLNPSLIFELLNVRAVIASNGGRLSHLAIVCRERGIPVVSDVVLPEDATEAHFLGNSVRVVKVPGLS